MPEKIDSDQRCRKLHVGKNATSVHGRKRTISEILGIDIDPPSQNKSQKKTFEAEGGIKESSSHKNTFENDFSCIYFSRSTIFY